jgi:hypothetical protein
VQRRPHHLGQRVGVAPAGDHVHGRTQFAECRSRLGRRVVGGEGQGGRPDEHRVKQHRAVVRKSDERESNSCDGVGTVNRATARRGKRFSEFSEPLNGDSGDDVFHAGEVFVEHGLAVFDLGGQPAGGDGVPAFVLGKPARGGGDQFTAGGALTRAAVFDGHSVILALIPKIAMLLTSVRYGVSVASMSEYFALIAVLGTAVVYGTDVFCALVQRPALARVDDRALVAMMGNVHLYGDRRMPVPGVIGMAAAAASAVLAAVSGHRAAAIAAGVAVVVLVAWLVVYLTVSAPINRQLTTAAGRPESLANGRELQHDWDRVITIRALLQAVAVTALCVALLS